MTALKLDYLGNLVKIPDKGKSEKQIKDAVVRYLKKHGWIVTTVYLGGIPTPGGLVPNPLKGFPDLICFHEKSHQMIFIELKKERGGKISKEQIMWHERLALCGMKVAVIASLPALKLLVGSL